jgi:glycosyltransferase involved in cell wall biosynthesis
VSSPPRLRVGIDVREWVRGRRTGIGRYLANLVGAWTQAPSAVDPLLYANVTSAPPPSLGPLPLRRLPEPARLWWDQVSLPRALARDRAQAFLSPYYKAPLLAPCPVVITVHDLLFLTAEARPGRVGHRAARAAFLAVARVTAARAARVITDSERSRDDVLRWLEVPEDKVRVIPIGLAPGHAPAAAAAVERVRAAFGLETPYVLYVGNFKPHKNLPRLVAAFAALPAELRARHRLVLAGSADPFTPSVEAVVRALGLGDRVRITGYVADADLAALYTGATAATLPSLAEGFGVPIIEAMACGTPVVCSDVAPLRDVAGTAAVLVDPRSEASIAAGLGRVLTDRTLRTRLALEGPRRAREFSAERSAAAVEAVLREAAAAGTR